MRARRQRKKSSAALCALHVFSQVSVACILIFRDFDSAFRRQSSVSVGGARTYCMAEHLESIIVTLAIAPVKFWGEVNMKKVLLLSALLAVAGALHGCGVAVMAASRALVSNDKREYKEDKADKDDTCHDIRTSRLSGAKLARALKAAGCPV